MLREAIQILATGVVEIKDKLGEAAAVGKNTCAGDHHVTSADEGCLQGYQNVRTLFGGDI